MVSVCCFGVFVLWVARFVGGFVTYLVVDTFCFVGMLFVLCDLWLKQFGIDMKLYFGVIVICWVCDRGCDLFSFGFDICYVLLMCYLIVVGLNDIITHSFTINFRVTC